MADLQLHEEPPEGTPDVRRIEHIQRRLRAGYAARAPEDCQWLIGVAFGLMEQAGQAANWKARAGAADERISRLERSNGNLLVQVDRLRTEANGLREELSDCQGAIEASRRRGLE